MQSGAGTVGFHDSGPGFCGLPRVDGSSSCLMASSIKNVAKHLFGTLAMRSKKTFERSKKRRVHSRSGTLGPQAGSIATLGTPPPTHHSTTHLTRFQATPPYRRLADI